MSSMSETGLEEKVENMNVEEKEPKAQKGGEKAKGEKKKKEDSGSGFPLEVSHSWEPSGAIILVPRGRAPFGQHQEITTSGLVQHRKSTIHGLPVTQSQV